MNEITIDVYPPSMLERDKLLKKGARFSSTFEVNGRIRMQDKIMPFVMLSDGTTYVDAGERLFVYKDGKTFVPQINLQDPDYADIYCCGTNLRKYLKRN